MFYHKIIKIHNSLAVVIPIQIARHLNLSRSDYVATSLGSNNEIIMVKIIERDTGRALPIIEINGDKKNDKRHHKGNKR